MYTNIDSITNKIDLLQVEVARHRPTFIVITESWLREHHPDSLVVIPGYDLLRRDRHRTDRLRGGGVIIYFARQVQGVTTQVAVLHELMTPLVEALWIQVTLNDLVLTVGGVYRPPSNHTTPTPADLALFSSLRQVALSSDPVVILGDFNFPGLTWTNGFAEGTSKLEQDFISALNDTNLAQLVSQNTRFRGTQTPALLDLILTNEPDATTTLSFHPPIGASDHSTIVFDLQCCLQHQSPPEVRQKRIQFFNLDYTADYTPGCWRYVDQ